MRCFIGLMSIAGLVAAQESAPVGIIRGDLSLLLVRAGKGTLDVRTSAGTVYQCDFDTHSLIERDNLPIPAITLAKGEQIEVLTDRQRERCYARIIRVLRKPSPVSRSRFPMNGIDRIYPRGNLTVSGIILRLNPSMLVLRTRAEAEKIIVLREDTRFLDSGFPGEQTNLAVNLRVFIRGSKTFDDTLEAHQVIWGEIAGPKSRASF